MSEETIIINVSEFIYVLVSCAILVVTIVCVAFNGKRTKTKRSRSRWTMFAVGVFVATLSLNLGLNPPVPDEIGNPLIKLVVNALHACLSSIQMIDAGNDYAGLAKGDVEYWQYYLVAIARSLLYVLSPVAFLGVVASYLSRFLAMPRAVLRSCARANTYVFSTLGEHSLTLAKNIRSRYLRKGPFFKEGANLVFASVNRDADDDLQMRAAELGALCVEGSIDAVWRRLFGHRHLRLVLVDADEISNITHASSIKEECEARAAKRVRRNKLRVALLQSTCLGAIVERLTPRVSIYSVTSLYGAESLLQIGERDLGTAGDGRIPVRVRRVDWTRNLIESALNKHPLFLVGGRPDLTDGKPYEDWQHKMLCEQRRHVVIVGAGHVGTEFLRLALSLSRFDAPDGTEKLGVRFDVFDNVEDPLAPGTCLARRRLEAAAPAFANGVLAGTFDTHFELADALGPDFVSRLTELDEVHGGITYVLVALGDDLATVQVSMRVREALERRRVRRNSLRPEGKRRESYLQDPKPIILSVVDDDDLAESLARAQDDGFEYRIETIGSLEDMYTFELIFGDDLRSGDSEESEYKRRSSRASAIHAKYKLFAYMASRCEDPLACDLAVDWTADLAAKAKSGEESDTTRALDSYNAYVVNTSVQEHEWLLRMEHDRWNAYLWSEGFVCATLDEVETFFDTCQTEERHRLNGANMHPCLVSFDELPGLDERIDALYDADEVRVALRQYKRYDDGRHKPFQLMDNEYLGFRRS